VRPCSHCGTLHFKRVKRQGLVERWILAAYGLYPWRCVSCNHKRYLFRRGKRVNKDGVPVDSD
jgi:hypothetical protein